MKLEFDWDTTEALWILGLLPPEELPTVATNALASGSESPSLIELAGSSSIDSQEARNLFDCSLQELGRKKMTPRSALRQYAKHVCQDIQSATLSPYVGAKKIWQACIYNQVPDFHELDTFIYAASEMEDRPRDKAFFEEAIRKEADKWTSLQSHEQRV